MANAHSSGAVSLMAIPTELLDQIASLLPRSALRALALTSKKANVSAIDILYNTYLNRTEPAKAPFHLFLRTICERPDLAAKVKHVDIRGWRSEFEVATGATWRGVGQDRAVDQVEKSGPSFTGTEKIVRGSATERFKLFVDAAVKAGLIAKPTSLSVPALKSSIVWYTTLREDSDFLRLLGRGVEDAQLMLMLALLPSMHVLCIDGFSPFPLLDWHQFLSRSSTALRKILALQITGSETLSSEPIVKNSLQFLDIMSSLVDMQLGFVGAGGHRFELKSLPSNKLERLTLFYCEVNVCLLRKILSGQSLNTLKFLPGRLQVEEITGSRIAPPDLVASLSESQLSLKKLTILSVGACPKCISLKMFENLEALEMPHPWILDFPEDEADPETIRDLLVDQLPTTLIFLSLRHLIYDAQTKTIMEQLALLKMQDMLPDLGVVSFNFRAAVPSSYVTAALTIGGSTGGLAAGTTWDPLPKAETKVQEELGELYEKAGIKMTVKQTDL